MAEQNTIKDLLHFLPVDAEDTRTRILVGAAKLFAEQGYARATTRALAAAVGVTEATLFRHFPSKENLFESVVHQFGGMMVVPALDVYLTGDDVRSDLTRFGLALLNIFAERRSLIRLILCEATHFPILSRALSENPRLLRKQIAAYLQKQVERGAIRPVPVDVIAQAFLGTLFSYGLMSDVLSGPGGADFSFEDYAGSVVDVLVDGLLVERK